MNNNTVNEKLLKLLEKGVKLPTFLPAGVQFLHLLKQSTDNVNIKELSDFIKREPDLTGKILKVANSPYYGRSRQISNVSNAITLIGLEETISILHYFYFMKVLNRIPPLMNFSINNFWLHSWACAEAARVLPSLPYLIKSFPGELYIAGLFHDIGKVLFVMNIPEEYSKCIDLAHEKKIPLYLAERERLGVDHAMFGASLLDNWNFPRSIIDAVSFHHSLDNLALEDKEMTVCIYAVNMIISQDKIGDGGSPVIDKIYEELIQKFLPKILFDPDKRKKIIDKVVKSLSLKAEALELTGLKSS